MFEFASPAFKSFSNGYHLNRPIFDADLLQECEKIGVTVLRPAELNDLELKTHNSILNVTLNGESVNIKTRWFIDASGNFRYVKKKLKWVDKELTLNTGAITAHFTNLPSESTWDREETFYWNKNAIGSKAYSTTHFLKPHSWWWLIKLDESTTSIGVVYDKNNIKFSDAESYFNQSIKEDKLLSKVTKNAKISKINHLNSLPYVCSKMHQDNVAVIGDAGAFIDPLFSPGLELICQQNEHLVSLLLDYFKTDRKDLKAWRNYEKQFVNTYLDRIFVYSKLYHFMHSFDLFSNATQLLFFGYQSFSVLPLKYFPRRIKYPGRFQTLDRAVIKWVFNRFYKISVKRTQQNRQSVSLHQPLFYSRVSIPNGIFYVLKPVQLALLWLTNYIKIEATEGYNLFKSECLRLLKKDQQL